MRIAVSFADHSERIKELLEDKLRAGVGAAAERLADEYSAELQKTTAPPHSRKGQIPHAYFGHKPGGFGPLAGPGEPQNIPKFGFTTTQTDFLATYIRGVAGAKGQRIQGLVGFADSHVTRREQNYLLQHDRSGRPWVIPIYGRAKQQMIQDFIAAFREMK